MLGFHPAVADYSALLRKVYINSRRPIDNAEPFECFALMHSAAGYKLKPEGQHRSDFIRGWKQKSVLQ